MNLTIQTLLKSKIGGETMFCVASVMPELAAAFPYNL